MTTLSTVIYTLWIIFWIGWISVGFTSKKGTSVHRNFFTYRLFLFVLIVLVARSVNIGGLHYYNHSGSVAKIIGSVLFAGGLGFAIWARVYLGKNWGMPMTEKEEPQLVTSGPYHFVRHPIYTGILTAVLGTALAVSYFWFVILVFSGVYFIYAAFKEEEYMHREFGKTFAKYKSSSKMLIPFIL
ncbi:MAG TPA: isoprenylcysteine carboxylmethyltransferase family protein [Candidatus Sulfotelmatobacter sp.]|nr:isoprenylcysteine carboxylmethyltransferase family protein [Candidatus Sulfotelmatobacter sp.]